jgi:hypothetical protein
MVTTQDGRSNQSETKLSNPKFHLSLPALRKILIQLEVASMEVIIRVKSFHALRDRLFVSKKPFFSNSKEQTSEITKQQA